MPTITNYGDLVTTGNTTSRGTGSSTFAGSVGAVVYQVAGTTVIDASRNLTNIGTVGSGAITSSSSVSGTTLTASTGFNASGTGVYQVAGTTVIDASRNLTNIGTVGSGAITSSSTVSGTTLTASAAHDTSGSGVYKVAGTTVVDASRNLTNIGAVSASSMSLSTALSIANGGTGATTAQTAINALVGGTATSGYYLRGNGTNVVMAGISAGDVPTLNQNTTGSAASLSATLAITSGGTGATTAQAAINALAGATTNRNFLRGDGTNVSMSTIQAADVPTLNQNTTGSAGSLNTTFTAGYVLYGQASGIPAATSGLSFDSVANTLTASGDIIAYSDRNIKTDIEPILDALSKVSRIGGYTFTRTDIQSGRRTGVIAQEVLEVLPEAVHETENGTLSVAYGNMVGLLIEAIKELRGEVLELKKRLTV